MRFWVESQWEAGYFLAKKDLSTTERGLEWGTTEELGVSTGHDRTKF